MVRRTRKHFYLRVVEGEKLHIRCTEIQAGMDEKYKEEPME